MTNEQISSEDVLCRVQQTPNPSAWKFIVNFPVLNEGKVSYTKESDIDQLPLVRDLLNLPDVVQIHLFTNVITVTHEMSADFETLRPAVLSIIQTRLPMHNPDHAPVSAKKVDRSSKPEDVQKVEAILDRTVRPHLQADGGDIEVVEVDGPRVLIQYEGACGGCPSSTTGTLMAIEGILQDEFHPEVEVYPVG